MSTDIQNRQRTDIVALVEATPVLVLTDKQKFSDFYEAMKAECDALQIDLATEKGRKAIASMAYKVARTKTAIDDAGKKLNEEARARINAVDESRREIRAQLDELKDEVRKPLTEWEQAEAERKRLAKESYDTVVAMGRVDLEDNAETVAARIVDLKAITMNPDVHLDAIDIAENARLTAIASLQSAHARLTREERERAELERLRAEAAEREEQERIAREAAEAARRKEADEKAAAEAKARAEAEQKAREESAVKAAEERARQEAEAAARAEREATERAHAEALAAEKRRADEIEAAARAEAARIAREASEQAARDADRAHRSEVMRAAKEAIMKAGLIDESSAKAIVRAIGAGNVPNISIRF